MSDSIKRSPTEALLRRRLTEATRQSMTDAVANLELLLSDAPLPVPAWADMDADAQILFAAETIVALRAENAPAANWTLNLSASGGEPSVEGSVHEFQHGKDFNARTAMARWGHILGGAVKESPSGAKVQIEVRGEYRGVPIRMWSLTDAPAAAAAAAGGAR